MRGEQKQATSATMAIFYITIGALIDVWTAVYFVFRARQSPDGNANFWCAGLFFSGLVLIGIGLFVGRIGRSARAAETAAIVPAQVVTPPVAAPQSPSAANPEPSNPAPGMRTVPADSLSRETA